MTPDQMKDRIIDLAEPLKEFVAANDIASFSLDIGDGGLDMSVFRRPLPPRIKCVLASYGCIYLVDNEEESA